MQVKSSEFTISAVKPSQYPNDGLPQIVLVGKSNVGKSSFINTMVNRKKLARTSSEPGKTRLINFYNVNKDFYFVDLPGYGYSKMSKVQQAEVGKFIEQYLHNCKDISLIVFLIDIRHFEDFVLKILFFVFQSLYLMVHHQNQILLSHLF